MEKNLEEAFAAFREAPEDERAALGDFIRQKMHAEPRPNAPGPGAPAPRAEPPVQTPPQTPVQKPVSRAAKRPASPAVDRPVVDRPVLVLRIKDMCAPPVSAPPRLGDWGADWLADWREYKDGDGAEEWVEAPPSEAQRADERVSTDPVPETRPAPEADSPRPAAPERRTAASDGAEVIDIFDKSAAQGEFRRLFAASH